VVTLCAIYTSLLHSPLQSLPISPAHIRDRLSADPTSHRPRRLSSGPPYTLARPGALAEPLPGDPALLEKGEKLEPEGANIEGLVEALRFPPSFKFGAATAAYQAEGGLNRSSWYAFERGDPPYDNQCVDQRTDQPCDPAGMAANTWARHSRDIVQIEP